MAAARGRPSAEGPEPKTGRPALEPALVRLQLGRQRDQQRLAVGGPEELRADRQTVADQTGRHVHPRPAEHVPRPGVAGHAATSAAVRAPASLSRARSPIRGASGRGRPAPRRTCRRAPDPAVQRPPPTAWRGAAAHWRRAGPIRRLPGPRDPAGPIGYPLHPPAVPAVARGTNARHRSALVARIGLLDVVAMVRREPPARVRRRAPARCGLSRFGVAVNGMRSDRAIRSRARVAPRGSSAACIGGRPRVLRGCRSLASSSSAASSTLWGERAVHRRSRGTASAHGHVAEIRPRCGSDAPPDACRCRRDPDARPPRPEPSAAGTSLPPRRPRPKPPARAARRVRGRPRIAGVTERGTSVRRGPLQLARVRVRRDLRPAGSRGLQRSAHRLRVLAPHGELPAQPNAVGSGHVRVVLTATGAPSSGSRFPAASSRSTASASASAPRPAPGGTRSAPAGSARSGRGPARPGARRHRPSARARAAAPSSRQLSGGHGHLQSPVVNASLAAGVTVARPGQGALTGLEGCRTSWCRYRSSSPPSPGPPSPPGAPCRPVPTSRASPGSRAPPSALRPEQHQRRPHQRTHPAPRPRRR